jgi:hypothetical protein
VRHLVSGRALAHVRVMSIAAGELALRLPSHIFEQLIRDVSAIEYMQEQRFHAFAEVWWGLCQENKRDSISCCDCHPHIQIDLFRCP